MNDQMIDSIQNLPPVVGVDVGGTRIRAAVLRGTVLLSRVEIPTGKVPTPDRIIPRICDAIHEALKEADTGLEDILGIGVGVAGELDSRTGIIYSSPNLPRWDKIPLRSLLEREFNVPIYVENDANVAAIAEYKLGAGRGCKDVVYLTISTGIGGGVIIDGQLMEGASGTGGELGHMTIDWQGDRCNCGNIGCLEYLASGTAIARLAAEAIASGDSDDLLAFAQTLEQRNHLKPNSSTPSGQDVSASAYEDTNEDEKSLCIDARIVALAAEAGIPVARSIIAQAAAALGTGLVNIIQIFNPERIVLGGGVSRIGSMLLEPATRIVNERAIKVFRDAVQIVPAQLGANAGLIGAATLVYQKEGKDIFQ